MAEAGKAKKWVNWDKKGKSSDNGSWIWCLGFVGALVYFWNDINSFWAFWVVLFKALVWPAYLVYHLFQFLAL